MALMGRFIITLMGRFPGTLMGRFPGFRPKETTFYPYTEQMDAAVQGERLLAIG